MRTYHIYKVTNKINGKVYIGQSCRIRQRIWEHLRCNLAHENSILHRTMLEYGVDNFDFEIIGETNSKEHAYNMEKFYIEKYDSYKNGYNQTEGGMSWSRWNKRAIVQLNLDGSYVRTFESAAEAERECGFDNVNVLLCCKNKLYTTGGYQFMFEDEYKEHGTKVYKKPLAYNLTPIIQCDMNGNFIRRYNSVNEASEISGVRRSTISGNITGTYKSAGGYIWVYEKDFPIKNINDHVKKVKGVKVAQINPKTNDIVATYDRIADAGRALGKNYKAIHKVLNKENRTAYGFKWISIS